MLLREIITRDNNEWLRNDVISTGKMRLFLNGLFMLKHKFASQHRTRLNSYRSEHNELRLVAVCDQLFTICFSQPSSIT